ncbi:MAG: ATP-binding protein [Coprobacillus sp.]|nr:ATP-binding protein [Coprobacillus sp.]
MLISFRFKNVLSFYNETTLSMEATKDKTLEGLNTFCPNDNRPLSQKSDLVKSVLIFGPNASGKSNILKALNFMKFFVLDSSSSSLDKPINSNRPFAFYETASCEDSLYEVEIVEGSKYYRYGFTLNRGKVVSEWLDSVEERKKSLFKREGNHVYINKPSSRKIDFVSLSETSLFLSIGFSFSSPISEDIFNVIRWFQKLTIISTDKANSLSLYKASKEYTKKALDILERANIGIKDMQVKEVKLTDDISNLNDFLYQNSNRGDINSPQLLRDDMGRYDLDLMTSYDVYDSKETHNIVNKKDIPLYTNPSFNSKGTENLLNVLGYIIDALDKGNPIFIDEFDSSINFLLACYLISMFNSLDTNPKNAQLIATVQNASLMDRGLRRDQIYFTEKDNDGVTSLYSLSDFKDVRKSETYSKKFLAGFYTRLPNLKRGI